MDAHVGYWNYRVVRRVLDGLDSQEDEFIVAEVFYRDMGGGETELRGFVETSLHSDTLAGLRKTLGRMSEALSLPVLEEFDFR